MSRFASLKAAIAAAALLPLAAFCASPSAPAVGPDGLDLMQLKTLAINGSPYYQAAFSMACRNGDLGSQKDYEQAVRWAKESSASGDPLGVYSMAVLLDNAFGVSADKAKAEEMFKSCATGLEALSEDPKDFRASYALGYLNYAGRGGLPVDKAKAAKLFLKAADAGDVHAIFMCGLLYQRGDGVERSNPKAIDFFLKAAAAGEIKAQLSLGVMYLKAGALGNSRQEASRWLYMAAEGGEADAQYLMGCVLENGSLGTKDLNKALQYYHRSALQGNESAKKRLKNFAEDVRKTMGIEKEASSSEAPKPQDATQEPASAQEPQKNAAAAP